MVLKKNKRVGTLNIDSKYDSEAYQNVHKSCAACLRKSLHLPIETVIQPPHQHVYNAEFSGR